MLRLPHLVESVEESLGELAPLSQAHKLIGEVDDEVDEEGGARNEGSNDKQGCL